MTVISKHYDDEVVLFYRYDSPFIFCRIKDPNGGWLQKTTKKKKVADALKFATDYYNETTFLHSRGMSVKRRTFSAMCDLYLNELRSDIVIGLKNERNLQDYKHIIDKYLRPYFGTQFIDLIKNNDIAEYQKWRALYWITGEGSKKENITYKRNGKLITRPKPKGKAPSHTTKNTELVVLRAIFKIALKHGLLTELQMPTISITKQKKTEKNRRPAFTKEEYEALIQFLFTWKDEKHCKNRERRWLLKHYVTFLVHSGLRPGTETDNLRWKHVKDIKTDKGLERAVLTVNGKTGGRNPVISGPAYTALVQIKTDMAHAGTKATPDMPIFCLPDGTPVKNDYFRQIFTKALTKSKLLLDAEGNQRSLYSLRHSYATFQLLYNKVDIYLLSKQLGTGIRMIEMHYGHVTPELAADDIAEKSIDNFL